MKAACRDCHYWVKKDGPRVVKPMTEEGTCHIYPPSKDGWPTSYGQEWCGSFSRRDEDVVTSYTGGWTPVGEE